MELDKTLKADFFSKNPEQAKLLEQLVHLQQGLRDLTYTQFKRVNPMNEDLTDWKERGEFLFGKGKNITVYNTASVVGNVEVGENTWIGPYTALDGTGGLKIGTFCSISSGVNIVSHDSVRYALSGGKLPYEYAPISIGDCCFIGTGVFIGKGISIGKHCVVGAGAVVTHDLPDFAIAAGVPAKIIGEVKWDGEKIELIMFK
jgi:acetyltransferase-like isoleucine patch superfamily enzyme